MRQFFTDRRSFFFPYLFIIVIMALFNIANYNYMLGNLESNSIQMTLSDMKNMSMNFSSSHGDIIQFINELDIDEGILAHAKNPSLELLDVKYLCSRLQSAKNQMPMAENILVYFKKSGIAVDTGSVYYLADKKNLIHSDSIGFEEFIRRYFDEQYYNSYAQLGNLSYFGSEYNNAQAIISSLPSSYSAAPIQVMILLNNDALYEMISPAVNSVGTVYDLLSDGKLLFGGANMPAAEVFADINNYKIEKVDGRKYILYNSPIRSAPWHLVACVPYKNVIKSSSNQKLITYATLVLSIILCILFGISSAKSSRKSFDSIIEANLAQSRKISDYAPHTQNEFLRKILMGETADDEIIQFNEKYHLFPTAHHYCVLRFDIRCDETSEVNFAEEMKLKKFIVKNVIEEICPGCIYVSTGLYSICFILLSDVPEAEFSADFARIAQTVQTVLIDTINYDLSYGFGSIVGQCTDLCDSFFEAGNNIALSELKKKTEKNYDGLSLSLEFEAVLTRAVTRGDIQVISAVFDIIKTNDSTQTQLLCEHLGICLRRVCRMLKLEPPAALPETADDYCREFVRLAAAGSTPTLFNGILDYIRENCQNPQLSRKLVADKFNISEEYVSMLFKKNIGETFLNYTEKIRIDRACRMILEQSGRSLESIASDCGYVNQVSFRRAFKKVTGVLPSQYKK